MGNLEEPSPDAARDAAGFVASLRQLKERAGLTYRELEERAARNGDVLARSTLADVLRRATLPRPDVLAAFVRACGDGQRLAAWLDARERIAADAPAAATDPDGAGSGTASLAGTEHGDDGTDEHRDEETGQSPPRTAGPDARGPGAGSRRILLTSVLATPLLALAAWALLSGAFGGTDDANGTGAPAAAASASASASGKPADGWVTVRPARTPDLCLTDGRDREGAYGNAVAVQLPCARAAVPRTYLEPAGEGLYRIQWHHPSEGKGCLTVIGSGPVKGMLEPRNDCSAATLFRVEAVPSGDGGGFRLRTARGTTCVGLTGDDRAEGAEAVEERCTGAADQRFLIRTD
ncbi:helix-turn-helix domain-containing protein [Streptomyces sp. NPDC017936]|uniref:helix-turn-helix domain-containing protein n=1 Tax=Streptomyces sp. NPDC017936 TaxID=3365016 RepID=UPI0037B188D0